MCTFELKNTSILRGKLSWEQAEEYCESLVEDGSSDWRLPTISELKRLVSQGLCPVSDECLSWGCYNSTYCDGYDGKLNKKLKSTSLWSSSFVSGSKESVRIMYLTGKIYYDHKEYYRFVRCYRD